MRRNKLLSISLCVTLKNNSHAGGKTNCYYLQKLESSFDITYICNFSKDELNSNWEERKLQGDYKIVCTQDYYKPSFFEKCINKLIVLTKISCYSFFLDYYKTCSFLREIKKLKNNKYSPKIIILDWTQCIFLSKKVRKIFPDSKIVGCEQDVSFLSYLRRIDLAKTDKQRKFARRHYNLLRKKELYYLSFLDRINVFNKKDADLLLENKISPEKIKIIAPYFDDFSNVNHSYNTKNIIFYGAMSRPENYECCIWFIENVFNKLPSDFTFTIIGANPHPSLLNYKSERIIITGFIKDVTPYFETSLCSVVPLLLGAGIKIKVLESMSAGIPVLTNAIGIEGISAKNKIEYLHCESPEDYISSISELANNYEMQKSLSENARDFMSRSFNYHNDSYV